MSVGGCWVVELVGGEGHVDPCEDDECWVVGDGRHAGWWLSGSGFRVKAGKWWVPGARWWITSGCGCQVVVQYGHRHPLQPRLLRSAESLIRVSSWGKKTCPPPKGEGHPPVGYQEQVLSRCLLTSFFF